MKYRRILIAYDGSEGAAKGLRAGIRLAKIHQAELCALAVDEKEPRWSGTMDKVQEEKNLADQHYGRILKWAEGLARGDGVDLQTMVRPGHPAKTIVEVAKEGKFDLIVMGHSGLSGVWARFLGTTTEKVSRHAPCSVLIVR
jgi:nucleotide-binding universal stress UspA family protein